MDDSEQQGAPFFPTAEGGAAPRNPLDAMEQHFPGAVEQHYLIVADVSAIPPELRDTMRAFIVRAAFEICGEGRFNVWENVQSIAVRCEALPGKAQMFSQRVREITALWSTGRTVRINQYTMSLWR